MACFSSSTLLRLYRGVCLVLLTLGFASSLRSEPITSVKVQGTAHGLLTIHTFEGKLLATGELVQVVHGDRVTSRLTFHFRDGSLDDETTVFTQRKTLQLVSDHVIQRGPVFPDPMDALVLANGDVTIRSLAKTGQAGEAKITKTHLELPPDTYNGMIFDVLMNLSPTVPETKVSMVALAGKGRLVHLSIKPDGQEPFRVGAVTRQASIFRIHIELGGITGVVAPLVGKQPDDIRVWMLAGEAPLILRGEAQLFEGGPVWRIGMTAPVWNER